MRDGTHQPLLDEIRKLAERLIVGEPHRTPAPFMGPVIDNAVADGLEESFLALMMKGGQPLMQLTRPIAERPFLTPAIIDMTRFRCRTGRGKCHTFWPVRLAGWRLSATI